MSHGVSARIQGESVGPIPAPRKLGLTVKWHLTQRVHLRGGTKTPFHSGELRFHVVLGKTEKSTRGMGSTVTRIRHFPSEGFTLNLLPKASPRERIWTQQSSSFKVTVTFYAPGRRWRMSPSFLLKLPSLLHRSQEHRIKGPGPGVRRPGLSLCPC